MKSIHKIMSIIIAMTLMAFSSAAAETLSAVQIMQRVHAENIGLNISADLEMKLIDRFGAERTRRIRVFSNSFTDATRRIMFFVHPANVKGTAFLIHDFNTPEIDDEQWLYLPSFHKTKRIGSTEKNTSFMGSDFTFADLGRKNRDDYTYTIMKEDLVEGHKVWLIDSRPANAAVLERDGYSRSILFVRQDNFFIIRAVNWENSTGNLKYMDVRALQKINDAWLPLEVHMTTKRDQKTMHKTILKYSNIELGTALPADFFSVRQMEKGI